MSRHASNRLSMEQILLIVTMLAMLGLAISDVYLAYRLRKKRVIVWLDCRERILRGEQVDPAEYSCLCPVDRIYLDGTQRGKQAPEHVVTDEAL